MEGDLEKGARFSGAARVPTAAIVGGGFSGLLTALHLLRRPNAPRVRLIERGAAFGRGAAYGSRDETWLLNVRASNMSAFLAEPGHFLDWLRSRGGGAASEFVSRARYGDYLQSLLRDAIREAPAGQLLLDVDEAVDATPEGGRWTIATRMGRRIAADAVVLATGGIAPPPPPALAPELLNSGQYVANPWAPGVLAGVGRRVLMLGAGLTMVDVAISLAEGGRRLFALSRRGLLPQAHAPSPPAPPAALPEGSPAALARRLHAEARRGDWRAAVDAWRPHLQAIWSRWSLAERQSFLRHLRPWWDIHRHRMAPQVAAQLAELRRGGALDVAAGQLLELRPGDGGVEAAWRPRGSADRRVITVDTIVNCGGFGALRETTDPLLQSLARRGHIRPDVLGLGVDVDLHGRAGEQLYAVGPLCRGSLWEITAVPDIRVQAAAVADALAADHRVA